MAVLEQARTEQFVTALVDYVREIHPGVLQRDGEAATRETIRYGIGRATLYGITQRRHVCLFIDVIFTHGRDFDVRLPWASAILQDHSTSAAERIDELFERASS